jgi:hypothetical protein
MSVDLKALDPAIFARYFGNPEGEIGITIATTR